MAKSQEPKVDPKKNTDKKEKEAEPPTDIDPPNAMANKYCDHYSTHNCTNQVPANQSLCANCAAGMC